MLHEDEMVTGYKHSSYAYALAEFGKPRFLPECQGWILEKEIPGLPYLDAVGCYPLFACWDWSDLQSDLDALQKEIVALSLITDPFGNYTVIDLKRSFELVFPFKDHYIIDLNHPLYSHISQHHRRNTRKALARVQVERCETPETFLDDWIALYDTLIERHSITGVQAFSYKSFAQQLCVPGTVAFRAIVENETVGMFLWYVQGQVGYYHLGAYNAKGYKLGASFALFWVAIKFFAENGLRWLSLGAGAGTPGSQTDGLSRFKAGWSTGTRPVYYCGKVFDHFGYAEVMAQPDCAINDDFRAYLMTQVSRNLSSINY